MRAKQNSSSTSEYAIRSDMVDAILFIMIANPITKIVIISKGSSVLHPYEIRFIVGAIFEAK